VAEYLKKTLKKQIELYVEHSKKTQTKMAEEDFHNPKLDSGDILLSSKYKIDMAMGPQGRNLVNKAYRSTKS